MSLLDVLKKRTQGIQTDATNALAQQGDDTAQASSLLAAKVGKASAGGAAPAASNLGEQSAIDEAKQALGSVGDQTNLATAEFGQKENQANASLAQKQAEMDTQKQLGQEQLATQGALGREGIASEQSQALAKLTAKERTQIDETSAKAEQAIQNMLTEKKLNENNIFQQFDQDNRELAYRRDAAQLEQLSQTLALRDRAYLDEINAIGEERNLRDNISFAQESNRLLMGENTTDVLQQLGWKESDLTDQLAFEKKIAQMSIDEAIKIANAQIAQDNQTAMISGVVNLGGIGVGKYMENQAAAKALEKKNLATINQANRSWAPSTDVPNNYETFDPYKA